MPAMVGGVGTPSLAGASLASSLFPRLPDRGQLPSSPWMRRSPAASLLPRRVKKILYPDALKKLERQMAKEERRAAKRMAKNNNPNRPAALRTAKAASGELKRLLGKLKDTRTSKPELQEVVSELRRGFLRDPRDFTVAISSLGRRGMLQEALDIFGDIRKAGFPRNVITYGAIVDACEKSRDWPRALDLLEQMHSEDVAPNAVTYNAAMSACVKGKQWRKALALFGEMKAQQLDPSVVSYSCAFGACKQARLWQQALQLKEEMMESGERANIISWSLLINVLERSGEPLLALQQYGEMKVTGFQPDPKTYTLLLRACDKAGLWKRAREFMDRLVQDGHMMNAEQYGHVVGACFRGGEVRMSAALFERMQDEGLKPSEATCAVAAMAYLKCDKVDDAVSLYEQARARGAFVNDELRKSMIRAFRKQGKHEKVLQLFEEAMRDNSDLPASAFNDAVKACVETQQGGKITGFFEEMRRRDLAPSGTTYQHAIEKYRSYGLKPVLADLYPAAISSCAESWQVNRALNLVGEMKHENLEPTAASYSAVIAALEATGEPDRSLQLFDRLRLKGFSPDARAMISAMGANVKLSRWSAALSLFQEMKDTGLPAGLGGYRAALAAAAGMRRWSLSLELLADMQQSQPPLEPESSDYSLAMRACHPVSEWGTVLDIFETMLSQGLEPNLEAHRLAIEAMLQGGELTRLRWCVEQLDAGEEEPDEATFAALVRGLAADRQHQLALRRLGEMVDAGFTPNKAVCQAALASAKAVKNKRKLKEITQMLEGSKQAGGKASSSAARLPDSFRAKAFKLVAVGDHESVLRLVDRMDATGQTLDEEELRLAVASAQALKDRRKVRELNAKLRNALLAGKRAPDRLGGAKSAPSAGKAGTHPSKRRGRDSDDKPVYAQNAKKARVWDDIERAAGRRGDEAAWSFIPAEAAFDDMDEDEDSSLPFERILF